jgi:hypothetical protein
LVPLTPPELFRAFQPKASCQDGRAANSKECWHVGVFRLEFAATKTSFVVLAHTGLVAPFGIADFRKAGAGHRFTNHLIA